MYIYLYINIYVGLWGPGIRISLQQSYMRIWNKTLQHTAPCSHTRDMRVYTSRVTHGWLIRIRKPSIQNVVCDVLQSWFVHICDSTRSCTEYVTCLVHVYVTWLVHICDMTRSYMWHDSFIHVIWLVHFILACCTRMMTQQKPGGRMFHKLSLWHSQHRPCTHTDSFSHNHFHTHIFTQCRFHIVMWLVHIFDVIYSCMWHDSHIYVTRQKPDKQMFHELSL